MKLNINNHDFSIIWEGIYYKALSDYPNITDWEIKTIQSFIEYEKKHNRRVEIESDDKNLLRILKEKLSRTLDVEMPELITECTACRHKGCKTDFLCHVASVDSSLSILQSGFLLSAKKVRKESIERLMKEYRNAAKDPADYFDYVMFSWGNCQAGDRLIMERNLNRLPNDTELSDGFRPGIRYFFKKEKLFSHPNRENDGYHAIKIKDQVNLKEYVDSIMVPEDYRGIIEPIVPTALLSKVHYVDYKAKDIWDWAQYIYDLQVKR